MVMRPGPLDLQFACFLRRTRGDLPYRQFAKKLGVSRSTLFRIENMEQSVTLNRLHSILNVLGVQWEDVFKK